MESDYKFDCESPAIIFGGGAALGAHQVGAMRRLEEMGVRPSLIIGSSIGVINAMAYLSGGIENLQKMWESITTFPLMFRPSLRHNVLVGHSAFDPAPFYARLEKFFDYEKVLASPIEMAFILVNLTDCREEIRTNREMKDAKDFQTAVRAAFTIPLLFPVVPWREKEYCDGGFAWNVPLEFALEKNPDAIFALTAISTDLPPEENLGRSTPRLAMRFMSLMWRNAGNNSILNARMHEGRFHGVPTYIVNPRKEHSGFQHIKLLLAYPSKSKKLIQDGYEDARRQLGRQVRAMSRSDARRDAPAVH